MEKMRMTSIVFVIGLVLFVSGIGFAEETNKVDVEVTLDYVTQYIWRGQQLNPDPSFQPGVNLGFGNFTAMFWAGSLRLTGSDGEEYGFVEVDLGLDYSDKFPDCKKISYSVGFFHYDFPNSPVPDTVEIYGGLSFDAPLNPSLICYLDVDEADGLYLQFSLNHGFGEILRICNTPIGMEIGAGLGWGSDSYNKYYWGVSQSSLSDFSLSASFPFEICDWTISPGVNFSTVVGEGLRDSNAYGDNDNLFGIISISKKF